MPLVISHSEITWEVLGVNKGYLLLPLADFITCYRAILSASRWPCSLWVRQGRSLQPDTRQNAVTGVLSTSASPQEHSSPRDGCTAPSNVRGQERAAPIPPSWLQP